MGCLAPRLYSCRIRNSEISTVVTDRTGIHGMYAFPWDAGKSSSSSAGGVGGNSMLREGLGASYPASSLGAIQPSSAFSGGEIWVGAGYWA